MIELFRTSAPMTGGIRMPPTWGYIQRNLKTNIDKVKSFYQTNPIMLRNEHFLTRLISGFPVSLANTLSVYYKEVDRVALDHARQLDMTSAISYGKVRTGGFFGFNNPEILIACDTGFDPELLAIDWKNAQAVTVLSHGSDDFMSALPTPSYYWSRPQEVSTILVNVPMLMVQFHCFHNENKRRPPGEQWSVSQFVAAYVLPNMLASIQERALFNRLKMLSGYVPLAPSGLVKQPHPFALMNFNKAVDSALIMVIENIQVSSLNFDTILKSIPSFNKKHMYEAALMPDIVPMRQIDWALTVTRLADMDWLFYMAGDELLQKNQKTISKFFTDLRRNDCYNLILSNLPISSSVRQSERVDTMLARAQRSYL